METTLTKQAIGVAHGKIILIGEHAAVYSKPAIALPCTGVKVNVTIKPWTNGIYLFCDLFKGEIIDVPTILLSIRKVIENTLYFLNQRDTALHIAIDSTIPLERGMGSSAAVACAIVRGLCNFFNQTITNEQLSQLIDISEKIVHGNPSGLDAAIIVNEQPIYFVKNEQLTPITFQLDRYLVIADSGITGQTKQAIDIVKSFQQTNFAEHSQRINQLGEITNQILEALTAKDAVTVGKLMTAAHDQLKSLHVSHPKLDEFVSVSLAHGALGAKMTGGGLGGCMIALCQSQTEAESVAHQLTKAGAINTYIQSI